MPAALPVAPGGVGCPLPGGDCCAWAGLEVAGLVLWLMLGLAAPDFVAPEPQAAVAASPKPSRPSTARRWRTITSRNLSQRRPCLLQVTVIQLAGSRTIVRSVLAGVSPPTRYPRAPRTATAASDVGYGSLPALLKVCAAGS